MKLEILVADLAVFFIEVAVLLYVRRKRPKHKDLTTRAAAVKAMDYLQEWAKWMAGILTAAIGSLAYVVLDSNHTPTPLRSNVFFYAIALGSFVWLGSSLFCAAWLLSSLSSMSLRMRKGDQEEVSADFDFYELPLYGFMKGNKQSQSKNAQERERDERSWPQILFGDVMAAQFWFWGLGLFALGITIITILSTRFSSS